MKIYESHGSSKWDSLDKVVAGVNGDHNNFDSD